MIDKGLYGYPRSKFTKGGPVQLEFNFGEEPKPTAEVIDLTDYLKPSSPIMQWWKAKNKNKKSSRTEYVRVDDIAPYLSKFFSNKQLDAMSEEEMLIELQKLIETNQI